MVHPSHEENLVLLRVIDNGCGFPAEILPRIFEPYVTTKAKGTGLGLAIVEKIVEARIAFEQNSPDLVLLDIWMPDTDGITLLKEWAAGGKIHMPVIMMSGH